MTKSIAFALALALPLRSTAPRTCSTSRRVPVAMRVVGDPERSKDDMKEDDGESPLVGGVVPPAEFQDNDALHVIDIVPEEKGVAGIAKDNELLLETTPPVNARPPQVDVEPNPDQLKPKAKKEAQVGKKPKGPKATKTAEDAETKDVVPEVPAVTESREEVAQTKQDASGLKTSVKMTPEQVQKAKEAREAGVRAMEQRDPKKAEEGKEILSKAEESREEVAQTKQDASGLKTSVKMTPEQVQKAKEARAAAVRAAEERDAKKAEQGKEILSKAEDILVKVGTKSKAFELGEVARANAEVFVEKTISEGEKEEATQQEKLNASAANAAKSLVAAITKGWEETVAPKIREVLPSEYREVSNKALASAAVGLFVAVVLFPSLFPGGQKTPKEAAQKKIDSETAMLEKKLLRDRSTTSAYRSRSASQKAVFPPEEKLDTVTAPSPSKPAPTEPKTQKPVPKIPEAPSPQASPSLPPTSLSTAPKPEAATPPVSTIPTPVPIPAKPVEPMKPKETEPPKPSEVSPGMVMASVSKALGPSAGVVNAASFDSLSPQPTIVLEVSKAYHNMPVNEQKRLAQIMLQSARSLGYERVSLVEIGTGVQVAHAGVDVDLEDETDNLRAQVSSLQQLSDKLAMQNASKEAEINTLNTRMSEEREEFALQQAELEKSIKTLRGENSGLIEDLADAKAEISKMPDRMALEERTLEAERKSEKMSDTVEMLSMQLSKAREEETLAKRSQAESLEAANQAVQEKDQALASVSGEITQAQKIAEDRADERIATVERDAQASIEKANKQVNEIEEKLERTIEESKASEEKMRTSYEKQLSEQKDSNEKEVQSIQSKYQAMLEEVQKRAQAELDAFQREADRKMSVAMKEAKSFAASLTKERDNALKEAQKAEKQAQKASDKAEREKQGLQKRIENLEAKLKKKAPVQDEQPVEVGTQSSG